MVALPSDSTAVAALNRTHIEGLTTNLTAFGITLTGDLYSTRQLTPSLSYSSGARAARVYRYRVRTMTSRSDGVTRESSYSDAVLVLPAASAPSPVKVVAANAVTTVELQLGVVVPFDGGCPMTNLTLTRAAVPSSAPTGPQDAWSSIVTQGDVPVEGSQWAVNNVNLTRATQYTFSVTAGNALGVTLDQGSSGAGGFVFATAVATPTVPRNFAATRVEAWMIQLDWSPPADDGGASVHEYRVYMATALANGQAPSFGYILVFEDANTRLVVQEPEVAPNTTYSFYVLAVNSAGSGKASPPLLVTTLPPLPCPNDCSDHGSCHAWNGTCTCDRGYAPPACDTYDGQRVDVVVDGEVAPAEKEAFIASFVERMAPVLLVPAERLVVLELITIASRRLADVLTPAAFEHALLGVVEEDGVEEEDEFAAVDGRGHDLRGLGLERQGAWHIHGTSLGFVENRAALLAAAPGTYSQPPLPSPSVSASIRALLGVRTRVVFVVLPATTLSPMPPAAVAQRFRTMAASSDPSVGALGIASVEVSGEASVVVVPPSCASASACSSCNAITGCGWCLSTGSCVAGTGAGPGFGYATCPEYYNPAAPSPNNVCLPPCTSLGSSCDDCLARTDCRYCEATQQCHSRLPETGSCPAWDYLPSRCPSQRCPALTSSGACVLDLGCGYCDLGKGACLAGDSFGPTEPGTSCLSAKWRYGPYGNLCGEKQTCESCFATADGGCGWCTGRQKCATANKPGHVNSTSPLSGTCTNGEWVGNSVDCAPVPPTDSERCIAATTCSECLAVQTEDPAGCGWCSSMPSDKVTQ